MYKIRKLNKSRCADSIYLALIYMAQDRTDKLYMDDLHFWYFRF